MTFGEVDDVDVVAEASAVVGCVIVAEDIEFGEFAGGNFHDVRHEVVGDTVGVFAEETGGVVADRIKVAKSDDVEFGVGGGEVFEDFLNHVFGFAVGIGELDAGRHGFDALFDALVAIDGGRRGEDEVFDIVGLHGLEEIESAGDVVVVIAERLFDGFGDGFEPSEMNDEVEMSAGEDLVEGFAIEEVDFVEGGLGAGDLGDSVEDFLLAIDEIVDDFDGVTLVQ